MSHLVPRNYQLEAAAAACKENRIVNLPTGTGKTLIAALVHEWINSRMTLIVCPSVAVIEQHRQFFHSRGIQNIIVDTAAALMGRIFDYGGLGDDDDIDDSDVNRIIMQEMRQHVLQKVADVQLVVFDECHHAIGHHPYVKLAQLLCKYKGIDENGNTEDGSNCRILGLTASFIHGSFENISKKRQRLENNLHAKLWTPQSAESLVSLGDKNPMKCFYKVDYKAPDTRISKKDIEKRSLELMTPVLKTLPYGMAKIVSQEVSKSAYLCYYILGEVGWSFFLRDGLVPYLDAKLRQKAEYVARDAAQQSETDLRYHLEHDNESLATSTHTFPTADELGAQRAEYLIPLYRYLQQSIPIIDQLSPKCESLIEILESCTSSVKKVVQVPMGPYFEGDMYGNQQFTTQVIEEQDQSLVFVERAVLCIPLAKVIEMKTKRATRPVMGVQSMSADTRNATLQDFKKGSLKIIVATSSLEEGIDVADCKVVVRFDYFSSVRSHIQGSGRARHPDAKIFYFEQEPDIEEKKASLMTLAAGNPKMDVPDIEPQTRNMVPGIDDVDDGKKVREPPHLRVREYPTLADCGVGHRFDKEETTWDPVQNKSQRTMECQQCKAASVVIKSRAFGQGRKKKERYYVFGGLNNPWVCKYATEEEIWEAAERQGQLQDAQSTHQESKTQLVLGEK